MIKLDTAISPFKIHLSPFLQQTKKKLQLPEEDFWNIYQKLYEALLQNGKSIPDDATVAFSHLPYQKIIILSEQMY